MNEYSEVSDLFNCLNTLGDVIIVGGALRDFAFKDSPPRDIDLIIDNQNKNELENELENVFKKFDFRRNRFGGYKVVVNNLDFDIWSIYDNWAFKEGIHNSSFSNISKGTFYNFDAIAFNMTTHELDADIFIQSLSEKLLDITLEDNFISMNPTPEINVLRAFKIRECWGLEFSEKVQNYISAWYSVTSEPEEKLKKAELKHYGKK
ncbi:hypothetical protein [Paenibacillus donghaensis]|uniref:Poly A polymerase head domain-containing protein n=1 Tax=Paenibacillus donghaensis TaxID=414771 RepID=A0A2Z2K9T4_9BACL|nr:hypothetical protein [Paenibacillus donghaensis]ASA19533.1 hypothetical protein B9T62_01050 [Paenibacillus donghaensis]